jgi:hypothetical protein
LDCNPECIALLGLEILYICPPTCTILPVDVAGDLFEEVLSKNLRFKFVRLV